MEVSPVKDMRFRTQQEFFPSRKDSDDASVINDLDKPPIANIKDSKNLLNPRIMTMKAGK